MVRAVNGKSFDTVSTKGGFKTEDTGNFYVSNINTENLNKLFTVLGAKFKFSAQDSDLDYSCRRLEM